MSSLSSPVPPSAEVPDDDPTLESPPVDRALAVVTAIAVVVGVALRFYPRSDLWLDEALTVNISTLPLGEIGDGLRRDGHPPLYYWLLHLWTSVGGESDWWVRALSGVISLISLPLSYLAGRRVAERSGSGPLGARRTGLIALTVMAVMPFGVRYGAEARMYSLVVTLVLVGYLLLDDLLTGRSTGRRRWVVAAGVALTAGALLWTHYWSMWLLAMVGLWLLVLAWRTSIPARRVGALLGAGAMVVGGLLFLPWAPTLLYQSAHTGTPWGELFGPAKVFVTTVADYSGDELTSYLTVALVLLALTATVVVLAAGRQRVAASTRPEPRVLTEIGLFVATLGLGWAVATATSNTFSSRYAAVVYPLFVLGVAAGIALFRSPRVTVVALVVLIALCGRSDLSSAMGDRTQAGQVADRIAADIAEGGAAGGDAVVVACPDQIGVALDRSLSSRGVDVDVVPYPNAGDPDFIDWVDYADRNAAADPAVFWNELSEQIGPDTTVYAVMMGGYKTFGNQCEQLLSLMSTGRTVSGTIESATEGEAMGLWILEPTP